jgi:hypothetical protein
MTVFRWLIGSLTGLFAVGSLLAFVVFISTGIDLWLKRTRHWRRLAWAMVLFWFNIEIWRRVLILLFT